MANDGVYDKAKWHYGGDYPKGLPEENAFIHTGVFLGWLIDRDLYSDFFQEETEELIPAFKNREKTGAQVYQEWDGALCAIPRRWVFPGHSPQRRRERRGDAEKDCKLGHNPNVHQYQLD